MYIADDINRGIDYDWKKIKKAFRKLKCPPDVWDPSRLPLDRAKYFLELSERSNGKTTNAILLGLVMYKLYGTKMAYIRQHADMIAPKNSKNMFDTILEFDYISKIFEGRWNSVTYKSKRWFLCLVDEDHNIIDIDHTHVMIMMSIDKATDLKSSFNGPTTDFLIFDEFIGKYYQPNEFVLFCDLVKTIIRDRESPFIFMLANTINKNSVYFDELEIHDDIVDMAQGESRLIQSARGTYVNVEILEPVLKKNPARKRVNQLFFGWGNPLMASITGSDWAVDNYPHIPIYEDQEERTIVDRTHYLQTKNKLLQMEIVQDNTIGCYVAIHPATRTYEDSVIYTLSDLTSTRERFRFGYSRLDKFLWNRYSKNLFFYSSNDIGSLVEDYIYNGKKR